MEITKISNNNPIIDNLVFYTKKLVMDCILKDPNLALKDETLDADRAGSMYLLCYENRGTFDRFTFNREQMIEAGVPDVIINEALINKYVIPENYRTTLVQIFQRDYILNYNELNDYYRNLNGLPNKDDAGTKIDEEIKDIDPNKYIHEMSIAEVQILESLGIIQGLIKKYPDKLYFRFLGKNKVPYHISRRMPTFGLLYYPDIGQIDITSKFKEKMDINRTYCMNCIYSEAFKFGSDYYDNIMMILIKVMCMVDMINEMPDFIIRKDLFDISSIKYMFESSGVDFFPDIPMKYQVAMLKNLNKLISLSSTTRNIIDICSIFGFNDVNVFKYYLLKERKPGPTPGTYSSIMKTVPDGQGGTKQILDNEANFDLKFVKIPIDGILDDYVRNPETHLSYDEIVKDDIYWAKTDTEREQIKTKLLNKVFNTERTKYISIDTVYDMNNMIFELCYFFNMIFDQNKVEDKLTISIPMVDKNKPFKLLDACSYLYCLLYVIVDVEDIIIQDVSQCLNIKGFNFQADMGLLHKYVVEQGFTLEELGCAGFKKPDGDIVSFNQLMEIFLNNRDICRHIIKQIDTTTDKKLYDVYKKIYEALMTMELSNKIFTLENGTIARTYTEFLEERDPVIALHLYNLRLLEPDEKRSKARETINDILNGLEKAMSTTEFIYLFDNIPSFSSDSVKGYLYQVINFYKSYKIELNSINNIYKFSDKTDNIIKILDWMHIVRMHTTYDEYVKTIDRLSYIMGTINMKDLVNTNDFANIVSMLYKIENVDILDKFVDFLVNKTSRDKIPTVDEFSNFINSFNYEDSTVTRDVFSILMIMRSFSDKIDVNDTFYDRLIYFEDTDFSHFMFKIKMAYNSNLNYSDTVRPDELLDIVTYYD